MTRFLALALAEPALCTGPPKPTAHRLIGELVRLGPVERNEEGGYRIGPGLFVLGQSAPTVRELRDENVHLAVPDGADTLFLEKVTGHLDPRPRPRPPPCAALSVTGGTRRLDVDHVGARVCAAAQAPTGMLSFGLNASGGSAFLRDAFLRDAFLREVE